MDVREQLRTAPPGPTPSADDARRIFERGRRRVLRRRVAGAGAAVAVLLVAVVVAGPFGSPGSPVIEDEIFGPPDAPVTEPDRERDAPDEPDEVDAPEIEGDDAGVDDTGSDDEPTAEAPPLDADASTDDRESPHDGPVDLELIDIRVGTHAGFDRVVLEFSGEGRVGWFMDLGDQAIEDGSGEVVDVDGGAVLNVAVNALAFPPDLPDPVAWNGVRIAAPAGAGVLTEVVGSIWFEAQQQVFVGLDRAVPYRVVRLDDPQRLVIDLVHP